VTIVKLGRGPWSLCATISALACAPPISAHQGQGTTLQQHQAKAPCTNSISISMCTTNISTPRSRHHTSTASSQSTMHQQHQVKAQGALLHVCDMGLCSLQWPLCFTELSVLLKHRIICNVEVVQVIRYVALWLHHGCLISMQVRALNMRCADDSNYL
jgi:hypothetical protein